jgi:glutathione S-transferase
MYELHIGNKNYSSWSLRPWILLRQLNIPFVEHIHLFTAGTSGSSWDDYRRFSPTGKVPCLHADGTTAWDSLGITEFVAEKIATVWPRDSQARIWARCASAEMHSGFGALREQCSMNCSLEIKLHAMPEVLRKDVQRLEELWCEGLEKFGGPYLAGSEFTAVDAFFCPVASRVQTYGLHLNDTANAYAQRLLALPAMREWYAAALLEPVEPGHEEGCLKYGAVVRSFR